MDIKKKIKESGKTIEEVAAQMTGRNGEVGISQSALTQMLAGDPSISRVRQIANILGLSLSELVRDEEEEAQTEARCPHCGQKITVCLKV